MKPRLVLEIAPGQLTARIERRGAVLWAGATPWGTAAELADAVAALAGPVREHGARRRVIARLAPGAFQARTLLDLPPVPSRALALLVARGASRYFRQNGHPLVTAARWTVEGTPPVRGARAVATDEALAAAVLRGAADAGLWLEDLVPGAAPDGGFSLLPVAERARRRRAGWARAGWIAAAGACLCLVLGLVVWGRLAARARVVEADLARLAAPRAALLAARRSLDSAAALVAALEQSSARRGVVLDRLLAVARGLPDSTVLLALELDAAGRAALTGRAAHATTVVRVLARDTTLGRPRLTPETARDSALGTEWERFVIRLGPEPAP